KAIADSADKFEINLTLQSALRDIKELKTIAPTERQKLNDYFVFCPAQELELT
ncbi:11615_t:CDS:1, partial [Ambispora leptoticha]